MFQILQMSSLLFKILLRPGLNLDINTNHKAKSLETKPYTSKTATESTVTKCHAIYEEQSEVWRKVGNLGVDRTTSRGKRKCTGFAFQKIRALFILGSYPHGYHISVEPAANNGEK